MQKNDKILIVDDSTTMLRILENVLKRLEYTNILKAKNGLEGFNLLEKNPDIKLLITDWNMPIMDGLEFVKKIRSEIFYKDLPIIMVTTEGGKKQVIDALKAGVNNYIVKPFTLDILIKKFEEIFI